MGLTELPELVAGKTERIYIHSLVVVQRLLIHPRTGGINRLTEPNQSRSSGPSATVELAPKRHSMF